MKRRQFLGLPLAALALAAGAGMTGRELCPVCGMMVSKYPNWTAVIHYRDGHLHAFDGPKDLFKFYLRPSRYVSGVSHKQIASVQVTDFYDLQRIDARQAFYVVGSDVMGPMGHELVPLASREDAEEFLRDHKGSRILRFDEVGEVLLKRLDDGRP